MYTALQDTSIVSDLMLSEWHCQETTDIKALFCRCMTVYTVTYFKITRLQQNETIICLKQSTKKKTMYIGI